MGTTNACRGCFSGRAPQLHLNVAQGIGGSDLRGREREESPGVGTLPLGRSGRAVIRLRLCIPARLRSPAQRAGWGHLADCPRPSRRPPRRASFASCGGNEEEASPHQWGGGVPLADASSSPVEKLGTNWGIKGLRWNGRSDKRIGGPNTPIVGCRLLTRFDSSPPAAHLLIRNPRFWIRASRE